MTSWAFYHGWAMDPGCFAPLAEALGGNSWFFDRGYTNAPSLNAPKGGKWNIITHSMGLWQVPKPFLESCDLLVVLGGFESFVPTEPRAKRLVSRSLKGLDQGLLSDPITTLRQFYQLCDVPLSLTPKWDQLDVALLQEDLSRLSQETWEPPTTGPKTLLIQGETDQVALPSQGLHLAEKLGSPVKGLPQTGHGCKLDTPELLRSLILQA